MNQGLIWSWFIKKRVQKIWRYCPFKNKLANIGNFHIFTIHIVHIMLHTCSMCQVSMPVSFKIFIVWKKGRESDNVLWTSMIFPDIGSAYLGIFNTRHQFPVPKILIKYTYVVLVRLKHAKATLGSFFFITAPFIYLRVEPDGRQ